MIPEKHNFKPRILSQFFLTWAKLRRKISKISQLIVKMTHEMSKLIETLVHTLITTTSHYNASQLSQFLATDSAGQRWSLVFCVHATANLFWWLKITVSLCLMGLTLQSLFCFFNGILCLVLLVLKNCKPMFCWFYGTVNYVFVGFTAL